MSSSILSIVLLAVSGLVLFLYAVSRLALTLRHVAGDRMKDLLGRFTRTVPAGPVEAARRKGRRAFDGLRPNGGRDDFRPNG